MIDETACGGWGHHTFCCPPSAKVPKCGKYCLPSSAVSLVAKIDLASLGWYTHNNGKCDSTCPSGMTEVGSNKMYCRKGYQAACCETDTVSMELFGKCYWGEAPDCHGSCPSDETYLASSREGSGGAICNNHKDSGSFYDRPYCCGAQEKNSKWEDCQLYTDIGVGPAKGNGFCRSGCPADRIRVAMDGWAYGCKQGAMSSCCASTVQTITTELTLEDQRFEAALELFLGDREGYCSNPGPFGKSPQLVA